MDCQSLGFADYVKSSGRGQQALRGSSARLADHLEKPESFADEKDAARAILKLFEPLKPAFNELEQASQRPQSKFPLDYENMGFGTSLGHLTSLQTATKALHLGIRAKLALRDSKGASADILTIIGIAHHTGSEPLLISHIVEDSFYITILQDIWEGLESGQFSASQLRELSHSLQKKDPKTHFVKTIRWERANLILLNQEELESYNQGDRFIDESLILSRFFDCIGMSNTFWFRSRLNYSRFIQEHFLTANGKISWDWVDLDTVSKTKMDRMKFKPLFEITANPYAIFIIQSAPLFEHAAHRTAQTATRIDLARIAIALELYRRGHGSYPATLAPLAPNYLDTVPVDLITGDPLHYRIKPDGTPMIYSVGLNKTDDGGLLKHDRARGDWVWQYTLPADFDEKDWRD